jgi:hypothetical protein
LFFGKYNICWINILIEKFAWKPILDGYDEEGIKMHYFLLKMQEKKCKTQADNQRLQEARMERDNMLKMHVKLREK